MTRAETIAHNAGVSTVLALALRSVEALEARLTDRPTRYNFAIGALQALAEEGRALILPLPPGPGEPVDADAPQPSPSPGPSLMEEVRG